MAKYENKIAKIVIDETVTGGEVIQFESQEQLDQFVTAIGKANDGSTEPIIKPDGSQLRPLTNGEKWLLQQLIGINLFLLLFSVIR